jgi:hypothetical protein
MQRSERGKVRREGDMEREIERERNLKMSHLTLKHEMEEGVMSHKMQLACTYWKKTRYTFLPVPAKEM